MADLRFTRGQNPLTFPGLAELENALDTLPRKVREEYALDALWKAADPLLDEMRASAVFADQSGNLRKSMKKKRFTGYISVRMGGGRAYYAPWVEFGHGPTKKRRKRTGSGGAREARPRPVVRTATQRRGQQVINEFAEIMDKLIVRHFRKRAA